MAETDARQTAEDRSDEPRGSKGGEKLTATDARQGEIVLGRFGRILWIAVFAVLIIGVAIFGW